MDFGCDLMLRIVNILCYPSATICIWKKRIKNHWKHADTQVEVQEEEDLLMALPDRAREEKQERRNTRLEEP